MATPQDSVAPPQLTDGGPGEVVPGRASWVQASIDNSQWLAGLSPAGATQHETSWTDLTPATGWASTAGQQPQIMREGKTIWLRGAFTRSSVAGLLTAICQLPAGTFDTTQTRYIGSGVTSTGLVYELIVSATGMLTISGYTTIAAQTGFALPIAASCRIP
ncbi:hypothetical protein GCM10010401_14290 [Rarobacter faecitabidus]|uniref:Uncharacterized protein n=1 Tax=Rarobacter faecitabidus TaxID=13243 RepID=A0A542ZDU5_RARFA|nr:hypothetical protein [Rarobacter faecitabidus]TQL58524.1 hypothetical protein FB461_1939 [Rarobacter faecitabidus]